MFFFYSKHCEPVPLASRHIHAADGVKFSTDGLQNGDTESREKNSPFSGQNKLLLKPPKLPFTIFYARTKKEIRTKYTNDAKNRVFDGLLMMIHTVLQYIISYLYIYINVKYHILIYLVIFHASFFRVEFAKRWPQGRRLRTLQFSEREATKSRSKARKNIIFLSRSAVHLTELIKVTTRVLRADP